MKIALGFGIGLSALLCGSAAAQYTAYNAGSMSALLRENRVLVGQPVGLNPATPTLTIVGLDAGLSAANLGLAQGQWRIKLRVWGGYNPSANPVFSNLLSEQTLISQFAIGAGSGTWGSLASGSGWTLASPVTVPTINPIGITYAFEQWDGSDWVTTTNTMPWTIVSSNGGGPSSGVNAMPTGKGWYQLSSTQPFASGNFAPSDAKATATTGYSGLSMRLYTRCTGDLTFDTTVDDSDFVIFAGAYTTLDCGDSEMPLGCPADYNGDGFVDDTDFVVFAGAYEALFCS